MGKPSGFGSRSRFAAFTLIELLVVIAIIALLIGILLPALGQARTTSKMVSEQAGLQQAMRGYSAYYADHKGRVIPGYINWTWAHPYTGANPYLLRVSMRVPDDSGVGGVVAGSGYSVPVMEGWAVKGWTWRFLPYMGDVPQSMIFDKSMLADFRSRPRGTGTSPGDSPTTWHAAITWHPSWGLNATYVGGDYTHGAFSSNMDSQPVAAGGLFYVRSIDDVRAADKLTVFGSARGRDINGTGQVRPGFYAIAAPRPAPDQRAPASSPWAVAGRQPHPIPLILPCPRKHGAISPMGWIHPRARRDTGSTCGISRRAASPRWTAT